MNVKILLLQVRNADDPVRHEEVVSFADKAGIDPGRITPFDLLTEPPTLATIRRYDAMMIGGSGDYYVTNRDLPRFRETLEALTDVVDTGHPTFASCFGFHLLVEALGGELVHDPDRMEVGTFEVRLTEHGRRDELFGCLSPSFDAQVGRKDRASQLPPGVLHLASSERCPYHAFRIPNKPIWATQFHPELNAEENRGRFLRYMEGYSSYLTVDPATLLNGRFRESPETPRLIPRFLDLVFG